MGTCCVLNWEAISWCAFLTLSISVSILGLVAIKEAHDIETRLNEVEKLLKTIISMPCKVSAARTRAGQGGGRRWPSLQRVDLLAPSHLAVLFPPRKYQAMGTGMEVCRCNQEKEGFCGLQWPRYFLPGERVKMRDARRHE